MTLQQRPGTAGVSGSKGGALGLGSAGGQNSAEDVQLLKEKLRLLEMDRKNFFEQSQTKQRSNKEQIRRMRHENKELKATIVAAKRGTGTVLEKEAKSLDDGIYRLTLRLDGLRDSLIQRKFNLAKEKEKLKEIDVESEPLLTEEHPLSRKIRLLENRLDKSLIKYNEAMAIKKTYEQIVKRLKEEGVGFDNQLAAIERTLKAKDHDYQELIQMSHEANHKKEVAKKELQDFKARFDEERRQKDRELSERKAYVQSKVDQTQRFEKKEKQLRQKESDDARMRTEAEVNSKRQLGLNNRHGSTGDAAGISEAEQERLTQYEEAFKAIREATGVSDVQEVLHKFVSQEDTHHNLQQMTRDSQARIDQLNIERAELTGKLEELRYSGSGQLGSRRIVEEFEIHLAEARNQTRINGDKYELLAKLLINVKGGIEHLVEKLSVFRSEVTPPQVQDDTLVEVLKHCEQKLANLTEEVVPTEAAEDALVTAAQDLPTYNRRVRLPREDEEDLLMEEEGADGAQDEVDDDAVLNRKSVKRISENSIQRETKKMKRKRREK